MQDAEDRQPRQKGPRVYTPVCRSVPRLCYLSLAAFHFSAVALPDMKGSYCCVCFQMFAFRKHLKGRHSVLFLCRADPLGPGSPLLPQSCKVGRAAAAPHLLLALPCTISLSSFPGSTRTLITSGRALNDHSCVLHFLEGKEALPSLKLEHARDILLQHHSRKNLKNAKVSCISL